MQRDRLQAAHGNQSYCPGRSNLYNCFLPRGCVGRASILLDANPVSRASLPVPPACGILCRLKTAGCPWCATTVLALQVCGTASTVLKSRAVEVRNHGSLANVEEGV